MAAGNLFEGVDPVCDFDPQPEGELRVRRANRAQRLMQSIDLDRLIGDDHEARAIWNMVERLDLSRFYTGIRARGSRPGRPPNDPKIMVALWMFATSQGVATARGLERLCQEHDAYRWICGGVSVNHHSLSDFRVDHGSALDDLLSQVVAAMMKAGIVRLHRVAQDGTRVRANAGAASFRRQPSLEECLREARAQVEALKHVSSDAASTDVRKQAAQERAAKERAQRVEAALSELEKVRESQRRNRSRKKDSDARASTTDPEARVMKMADGGFRPAFNMQIATDTESNVIVAARASNSGGDMSQVAPTLQEIERRTGQKPTEYLVDGGYSKHATVEALAQQGVTMYAPPLPSRDPERSDATPCATDSPEVAAWRLRMASDEGKVVYKERGSTIELANAQLKEERGLERLRVSGLDKVQCVLLWSVLSYNLMKWVSLMPSA